MNQKDWQDQLAESQTAYEELFPDLNHNNNPLTTFNHYSSTTPTTNNKNKQNRSLKLKEEKYQQCLQQHNFNLLNTAQFESSGKHVTDPSRRYSNTSLNYLETLNKLEVQFGNIVQNILNLQTKSIDPTTTHDKALKYQAELAQLFGDLDKFQVSCTLFIFLFDFIVSGIPAV